MNEMREIKLFQLKNAYRYNTFSLILAHFALENKPKNRLLDVGAGCGIIGILLKAHSKNLHLSLLEIQPENIELIKQNLRQNELEAELYQGDLAEFELKNSFDFVVCNPPFYNENVLKSENSHKNISKNIQALPLEILIKKVSQILKNRGVFVFCYESEKLAEICELLNKFKLKLLKIRAVYTKENTNAKLLLFKAAKGVKTTTEVMPPLILNKNAKFSEELMQIYDTFKVKSYDF